MSDLNAKSTRGSAGVWTIVGGGGVGLATLIYGLAGGAKAAPRTAVRVNLSTKQLLDKHQQYSAIYI